MTLVLTTVQLSPKACAQQWPHPVPCVGSRAKLGEGSTQRVSVCEGVNLAQNF